jgi:uncharacterized glyoxalase superfamily protein PhnB
MTAIDRRQNVYPALRYRDAPAAIRWIESAFGFKAESVHPNPDGTIAHAEVRCGCDLIMLGSMPRTGEDRLAGPAGHAWVYVAVDDTRRHSRARRLRAPRSSRSPTTRSTARGATSP